MHVAGRFGVKLGWAVVVAATAFVACGGSSKARDESGDDDEGGTAGTNAGTGAGGSTGASPGAGGASNGGSQLTRGGSPAMPVPPPGTQYCGGLPCDAPLSCCMTTGECFDPQSDAEACSTPVEPNPDPQGRRACASNSQCAAGEFCDVDGPLCRSTGHCHSIINCGTCASSDDGQPGPGCRVCGCDGNTYVSPQAACLAGVTSVMIGAGCGEPAMEGGAGSSSIPQRTYIPCGHDGQCPSDNFCCTIDSRCRVEADREICVTPPPGTRIACRTTADCGDREYCQGEGCTAPGGCVTIASEGDCGVIIDPVCGCDGVTYTSADCAASRGIRIADVGNCPGGE